MRIIIEIFLIAGAFSESFWLGIFTLGYVSYMEDKHKKTKNQLDIYTLDNKSLKEKYNKIKCQIDTYFIGKKRDKSKESEPMPDWNSIADQVYPYEGYTIVQYDKRFIIITPKGERLNKVFDTMERAREVIDERK